jgi:hypothetical protein
MVTRVFTSGSLGELDGDREAELDGAAGSEEVSFPLHEVASSASTTAREAAGSAARRRAVLVGGVLMVGDLPVGGGVERPVAGHSSGQSVWIA